MAQMDEIKANELKDKIKVLLEGEATSGDVTFRASIKDGVVSVVIEPKRHRSENRRLSVLFNNEESSRNSSKKSAAKVLVECINRAGPDNVRQLGIITSGGINFIVEELPENETKECMKLNNDLYVITKTSTAEKEYQIRRINEALKLGWKIEWVFPHAE